jgi:SAM-dependent methyltransferase
VDGTVALGNIVSFAAADGPRLLAEIARVTRPGGFLVADFPSPAASIQEFFHVLAESRRLRRVLRRPGYYLVDRVLDRGDQPRDPRRYARWEFRFYTAEEARRAVEAAGLAVRDLLAIAPIAAHQPLIAQVARQERRTWEELLRLEEKVGRRPGTLETGQGFVVFAVSRTSGRPARDGSRRPRAA